MIDTQSNLSFSAPGKLMLFGEHAVVYGYPCISAALNAYLTVSVEESDYDVFDISQRDDPTLLQNILEIIRQRLEKSSPIRISTTSTLQGYGIGSSSAVTVAAIRAIGKMYQYDFSDNEVYTLGVECMRTIQPKASGYDIATCIGGGVIFYDSYMRTFAKIMNEELPIVIGFSGSKASTPSLVEKVAMQYSQSPEQMEKWFEEIRSIVVQAQEALLQHDWKTVGFLMSKNHMILQSFSVSTPDLDTMVEASLNAGAYGAKLSGAGGGDCIIAIVSEEKKKGVKEAIRSTGGHILDIQVGITV